MKPKLVILRGKPTAGKSTAYNNLRNRKEMKDWVFVDHSALKSKLGKEKGKKTLFEELKKIIPTRKNIIIEEMSEKAIRNNVDIMDYDIIVFQFTVSLETAHKRDVQRSQPLMGKQLMEEKHKFHDKEFDHNAILIDGEKLNVKQIVELIIKKIRAY